METEIKLAAGPSFRLPDLTGVAKGITATTLPTLRLEAVYFDIADLRLAKNQVTLRHRKETDGDDRQEGWTLKLPGVAGVALAREEFSWLGARDALPPEAVGLVRAMTRGAPLEPVATVETERRRVRLIDGAGRAVAEVDDDGVVAMGADGRSSRFREIEVEAAEGAPSGLIGAVGARLREAGATEGSRHPKVFRVLGPKAEEPPDPVVPALDRRARLREVISASIAAGVAALVEQDPGIRLGGDSEHVHKARVATRQLRSDLRTFRPVLDRGWVGRMREEPRRVGAALGAVRDADVLLEELRCQGASLPKLDARRPKLFWLGFPASGRRPTNGS
jgi:inorganic triphosphatase YgiF